MSATAPNPSSRAGAGTGSHAWLPVAAAALAGLSDAQIAWLPPAFRPLSRPAPEAAARSQEAAGDGRKAGGRRAGDRTPADRRAGLPDAEAMADFAAQAVAAFGTASLRATLLITTAELELFVVAAVQAQTSTALARWQTPEEAAPGGCLGTRCATGELPAVLTALIPAAGARTVACRLADEREPARMRTWMAHDCPACPHGAEAVLGRRAWRQMHAELAGSGLPAWMSAQLSRGLIDLLTRQAETAPSPQRTPGAETAPSVETASNAETGLSAETGSTASGAAARSGGQER